MTLTTDVYKMISEEQPGAEWYINAINLTEQQIADVKKAIKDGILIPINFMDYVNEEGCMKLCRGDMLLPQGEYRRV